MITDEIVNSINEKILSGIPIREVVLLSADEVSRASFYRLMRVGKIISTAPSRDLCHKERFIELQLIPLRLRGLEVSLDGLELPSKCPVLGDRITYLGYYRSNTATVCMICGEPVVMSHKAKELIDGNTTDTFSSVIKYLKGQQG